MSIVEGSIKKEACIQSDYGYGYFLNFLNNYENVLIGTKRRSIEIEAKSNIYVNSGICSFSKQIPMCSAVVLVVVGFLGGFSVAVAFEKLRQPRSRRAGAVEWRAEDGLRWSPVVGCFSSSVKSFLLVGWLVVLLLLLLLLHCVFRIGCVFFQRWCFWLRRRLVLRRSCGESWIINGVKYGNRMIGCGLDCGYVVT